MQRVSVAEFRTHCQKFLSELATTGVPILLIEKGKPLAMVEPAPSVDSRKCIPGQFRGQGRIVGDIVRLADDIDKVSC